jgi:hypothetical protein
MMLKTKHILCCYLFLCCMARAQHPAPVETVLKKAGNNRVALEKAINHFKKSKDVLKLKAVYFLIAHMDIHFSSDYYWENSENKKIKFNELDYPNFDQAMKAFESIKKENPGLHPKAVMIQDIETITADYLIDNIEKAFVSWKTSPLKNTSFEDFCEYILPYRISIEPMQDWRTSYAKKYSWISEKTKTIGLNATLPHLSDDINTWFTNTWSIGDRKEPLPLLGSMQILMRKQGPCDDIASLGVFAMRSLGIPATINMIPYWATSKGGHILNTFFDGTQAIHFDQGTTQYNEKLKREPAKVLRITYSKQPETLASFEDKNAIPKGYLQDQNYIDVTADFWKTTEVKCNVDPIENQPKIVYASTFNGLKWQPFWWGKLSENQTQFSKICIGTVVLPQYYSNEKMIPAGYPIVVGEIENRVLTPNYEKTKDVVIEPMANYLNFKPKVVYKLFYWDKAWKLVDAHTASETTKSLLFPKVPTNALLLLVASNSTGLERPFIIDEKGNRTWF